MEKTEKTENCVLVKKRDGTKQPLRWDAITRRLQLLIGDLQVDPAIITASVKRFIYDEITTTEIDEFTASVAVNLSEKQHPDYAKLASRIVVSNLQKTTHHDFHTVMERLHNHHHNGKHSPLVTRELLDFVATNRDVLQKAFIIDDTKKEKIIHFKDDYRVSYFGFYTLLRGYLLSLNGKTQERIQHARMRVACALWMPDVEKVLKCYRYMADGDYTHASPTLYNAGTPCGALASCFLLVIQDDSIEGIYDTLKQCALISKAAGGIGLAIHNVRAKDSYIRGTNGHSQGIGTMLPVFNTSARYVDQGGGKRNGSNAMYLEPWHADIDDWLHIKEETGPPEKRARDLFHGLWTPDLFMKRVESNESWSLFCPNEAPGLEKVWGEAFERLYTKYEKTPGLPRKTMPARELWIKFLRRQLATGIPYLLFKDACNRKSNQRHLGTIQCSNLCTEIVQYASKDEVATCNLASVALPRFAVEGKFDFQRFEEVIRWMVRSVNQVIDRNRYPVPESSRSNFRHRPMALGVQGFAECLIDLNMAYGDEASQQFNKELFENMYFYALSESCEMAKQYGPYETFKGSPASEGLLQFDLWGVEPSPSKKQQWDALRKDIVQFGLYNSLLIGPMPTASTSQILGNCESFEPLPSNIYLRKTLAGEFIEVNARLVKRLEHAKLWNASIREKVLAARGSVQNILEIPESIRRLFPTAVEISPRILIDMAADRGAFIDQSQSFSICPPADLLNIAGLSSIHFRSWKRGLKTGSYYIRQDSPVASTQITVSSALLSTSAPGTSSAIATPSNETPSAPSCQVRMVNGRMTRDCCGS